uniref:Uncharacterized protein n=1 Tax=Arundo donax TaxID=35708 RepID=A0A0A8ZJZ0_ARUDO
MEATPQKRLLNGGDSKHGLVTWPEVGPAGRGTSEDQGRALTLGKL